MYQEIQGLKVEKKALEINFNEFWTATLMNFERQL
jgi:hypothetical protein